MTTTRSVIRGARPLPTEGAEVIDGSGRILLPGFVDAHRHVWQSALRGVAGDWTLFEYMARIRSVYSPRYTADDVHAGSWAGYLEALDAGITTVVDHSHAMRSSERADAVLDAMQASGIRGVLAYGLSAVPEDGENPVRVQVESSWRHDDVRRLRRDRLAADDGRVQLGIGASDVTAFLPLELVRRELDLGRELGLRRITAHVAVGPATQRTRLVRRLHRAGLLGPDLLFAHGNGWTDDELQRVADSGGSVVSTPDSELQMGMGLPVLARARSRGVAAGLGGDVVSGNGGDLFAAMRLALQVSRFAANERLARSGHAPAHLDLRARDVLQASPADVDTLLVGGDVVKRDGRLTGVAVDKAVAALEDSRDRLLAGVDPALVAAAEQAHAATLPLTRSGVVMSRVAGLMLRSEGGANRLLKTMLAAAERR